MAEAGRIHSHSESGGALLLIVMSVVGSGIGYAASILAARLLGPAAFQDYAVAVATLGLLCAVAESGVGKYSLKSLPDYVASEQWPLASGYWRFSVRTVLFVSISLSVIVVLWEGLEDNHFGDYPLGIGALFLPPAALCGVGIDLVMANRAPRTGMLIAHILLPTTTFFTLLAAGSCISDFTPTVAILCYGSGSVAGALYCTIAFVWSSPRKAFSTPPEYNCKEWFPQCVYFAAFSFLASWTLKVSLLVLELLPIPESEVACFAAAMETGCLILLLARSTDKLFQPEMSVIISQRSWDAGIRLRRRRYLFIGSGCGIFMLIMIVFGRNIMGLYGPEFVSGYPALCFVSFGACTTTLFSLAPAFLRFSGQNRFVIGTTIGGAVSMAMMTAILGARYGSTGAGIAFGMILAIVAVMFLTKASTQVTLLTEPHEDPHP